MDIYIVSYSSHGIKDHSKEKVDISVRHILKIEKDTAWIKAVGHEKCLLLEW